jgi:hypothetical protein
MTLLRKIGCAVTLLGVVLQAPAQAPPPRSFMVVIGVAAADLGRGKGTRACVIVGDDGQYHLESLPWHSKPNKKNTQVFVGMLSEEMRQRLTALTQNRELALLNDHKSSYYPYLSQKYVERIQLRIHREAKIQELSYAATDQSGAIPDIVGAFIPWLEALQQNAGEPLKDAEPNSCRFLDAHPGFTPQLQRR